MKSIFKLFSALCLFATATSFAQEAVTTPLRYTDSNKGKFYIYWGGNRGYFTDSDIRFRGKDYDFTLENELLNLFYWVKYSKVWCCITSASCYPLPIAIIRSQIII